MRFESMRAYLLTFIITFILIMPYNSSYADTLLFKNGDRISGIIVDSDNIKILNIRTLFNQSLKISKEFVQLIMHDDGSFSSYPFDEYNIQKNIKTVSPKTVSPKIVSPKIVSPKIVIPKIVIPKIVNTKIVNVEMKVSVASIKKTIEEIGNKTETSIKEATSLLKAKWSGRVNFGSSLQTGNTQKNAINTGVTLESKWLDKYRAIVNIEYNREAENSIVTKDDKMIEGSLDYFFRKKWFTNYKLGFARDNINKINLRTDISVGLGHQLFEQDELNLKWVLGGSYFKTNNDGASSESSIALVWQADYDQKIFKDVFEVFHGHKLTVPLNNTTDFLISSKTGLRIPLKSGIVASGQIDFDWDNLPQLGINKEDTKYSLTLGYEW